MSTNQSKKGGGVFGKSKTERELERKITALSTQIENMKLLYNPLINQVATLQGEVAQLKGKKETHVSQKATFDPKVHPTYLAQGVLAQKASQGGRKMKKQGKKI
jgi:regulator of replication initiation timing